MEVAEDELEFARDLHNESLSLPELTPEDRSHKLLMLHSTWEGVEMAERKVEEMKKEQARAHEEQVGANKEQASVKEEQQKWNIPNKFIACDPTVVFVIMN